MKQIVTKGIVLTRTNFGEADRIITMLTPDSGKVRLMAKGVRKIKSKLAGGIELFSISQITYLPGKKDIHTLISSRLEKHYGLIATDINRTMLGYEFLKQINRITEDAAEEVYFEIINQALLGLDDTSIDARLVELWFMMNLLQTSGHAPNLETDTEGVVLEAGQQYEFDFEAMAFMLKPAGPYEAQHIKLLRLASQQASPAVFARVGNTAQAIDQSLMLAKSLARLSSN